MAAITSGSSAILIRTSAIFWMIGSGVFGGAMMAFQVSTMKCGLTVSWIEGRLGK